MPRGASCSRRRGSARTASSGEPAYERDFEFEWGTRTIHSLEQHFVVRTDAFEVRDEEFREMWAPEGIETHGWWSVDELRSTDEIVYPEDLADRITVILAKT